MDRFRPDALLPLTPVAFEILLALADGERHGYCILQEVEIALGRRRVAARRHALSRVGPAAGERVHRGARPSRPTRRAPTSGGVTTRSRPRHRRRPRRGLAARRPGGGGAGPAPVEGRPGVTAPRRSWVAEALFGRGAAGLSARLPPPLRRRDARRPSAGGGTLALGVAGTSTGSAERWAAVVRWSFFPNATPHLYEPSGRHAMFWDIAARRPALRHPPGAAGAALHVARRGRAGAGHRRQQRHLHRGAGHPAEAAALRANPASW